MRASPTSMPGRLVDIGDTRLHVVERGEGYPLVILHGGPGLDHRMFGDYLDPLAVDHRLIFVDQRAQGRSDPAPESTWSLSQMAADVTMLAHALRLQEYAVLGHSYGAFVALVWAVESPEERGPVIISAGLPSSRYLDKVQEELRAFEPPELRDQVAASWDREQSVQTAEEVETGLLAQLPFHFANPLDPRIADYTRRTAGAVYSAAVLRHFSQAEYGGIEVLDRLAAVRRPTQVLVGRHDRTTSPEGARAIADGVPGAQLVVFEDSAHVTFVEETERYLDAVRTFLSSCR